MSLASRPKRVGLHLPLDVGGRDAGGARFSDSTRTLNVSGGGLAFESGRDLPMGSRLDLSIALPPPLRRHFGGKATYAVRAVVCRVERSQGAAIARIGVRFLGEISR
jgi:PilZ domain-containing protein